MRKIIALIFLFVAFAPALSHARIYIPIDQPSDQKFPIAVPDLLGSGFGRDIADVIRNDLTISGYFRVIPKTAWENIYEQEGISLDTVRFSYWTAIEAQALVKGEVKRNGAEVMVTLRLFDTLAREMLVGKQYRTDKKNLREAAHRFSDEIMEALTGIRGVFNTKIAYAAQSKKLGKDIFIMDMDGFGPAQITKNKSINVSPNFSPDGSKLVFTSYMKGNPDLYVVDVGKKNYKRITGGIGVNITPEWSPDGSAIALASSISGVANIYAIPPGGGNLRRITNDSVIDVSPTWSPDGGIIVFSSERAGGLHIYSVSSVGTGLTRLTFVGYQNDMPDYSPLGDKIVFAGRDMGTFDIFIMNPDGGRIQRLTIGTGSNEHPSFSPDGRFIAFSSSRGGSPAIYIMRADGSNQTRISEGNGVLPDWGPQVK